MRKDEDRKHRPDRNYEMMGEDMEDYRDEGMPEWNDDEREWDDHKEKKHHKDKKPFHFLLPLLFIVVGILIGKCMKKCCKNKKKRCNERKRQQVLYLLTQWTSQQVRAEIEKQEENLHQLRIEFERKQAMERGQQMFNQQAAQMRPVFGYYQNLPQQQPHYQPHYQPAPMMEEHIPVGRPINHSINSEYPHL